LNSIRWNEEYWWREIGRQDGLSFGSAVVRQYGFDVGFAEGFDRTYLAESLRGFHAVYGSAYQQVFRLEAQRFLNGPVLDFSILSLSDENGDGVLEPGEGVNAQVSVMNLGRKATPLKFGLSETVHESPLLVGVKTFESTLRGSSTLKDNFLKNAAQVSPSATTGQELSVALMVNGQLSETISKGRIESPVGVSNVSLSDFFGPLAKGRVKIVLKNKSSRQSQYVLKLVLEAFRRDGMILQLSDAPVTTIPAGGEAPFDLSLTRLSPLEWIRGDWQVRFKLVNSAGMVLDQGNLDLPHRSDDAFLYLVEIAKSGRRDHPDLPGTVQLVASMIGREWESVRSAGGNLYRDDFRGKNQPVRTLAGRLWEVYQVYRPVLKTNTPFVLARNAVLPSADQFGNGKKDLQKWFRTMMETLGK